MKGHLRIARPVTDLARAERMYCAGLELRVLGRFEDHDGFDGVMLGTPGVPVHLEFTFNRRHALVPSPAADDLLVLYLPEREEWERLCTSMRGAGFHEVSSANPYWNQRGRTFQDPDGYRVVLQREAWTGSG
jgi:catechol 2,3-dioxygenase-like lactoylglutathione lyase family enzyme